MSAEYNFRFRIDWNVPRFNLDLTAGYIGQVKVLGYPVVGSPTQAQIDAAVAQYIVDNPGALVGVSEPVKQALLQLANKVIYIDDQGAQYYQDLYDALYPAAELIGITATYTQSGTVYDTASLDDLKSDLVVTGNWSDGGTTTITTGYTLSGSLDPGTDTITVTYEGFTDTFTVTVTRSLIYNWDFTQSLTDTVGGVTAELVGATQTSAGIVLDAATESVKCGSVLAFDRTIEMDVTSVSYAAGNYSAILMQLWNGTDNPESGTYNSFGYHYSTTAANNKVGLIAKDVAHWALSTKNRTFLDGKTSTIRWVISAEGKFTIYVDGVDLNLLYNGEQEYALTPESIAALRIGTHSQGSYVTFRNMTVTGCRVYNGARYY